MNSRQHFATWLNTGVVLLMSLTLVACSKPEKKPEQLKIVMVTQPESNHQQTQSYAGEVQARQQTNLAFRVGGQVVARTVDVGDRVSVGQVIARLDVKDANLELNAARAQLEQAQSALNNSQAELNRFKQLLPDNAVSRSQYDSAENQYKSAQSSLKQAQSNYAMAQNQSQYNQLRATKNGVITSRDIEVGQVVAAGQTAYQLALDGERDVVIGVAENAVRELRVGQSATVSLWSAPEQRFDAYVREIAPAADQSRTFQVKVALRNQSQAIQLGQSARVFFQSTQAEQVTVPLSSISAVNDKPYVWVVAPNQTLHRTWVQLGEYHHDRVPVLAGLKSDQWVVVGGVHLLREKQKVRLVDENNRPVTLENTTQTKHQNSKAQPKTDQANTSQPPTATQNTSATPATANSEG